LAANANGVSAATACAGTETCEAIMKRKNKIADAQLAALFDLAFQAELRDLLDKSHARYFSEMRKALRGRKKRKSRS
jgi:hypothetical protein